MPRAMWNGSISFGLVNIPIKLYPAVSRKTVHFNQIDTRTNSRVRQKRVSETDGSDVPAEAIAKGYQLPAGEYVLITEEELAALDPEGSRTIEIDEFVNQSEIDPVFYDSAYLVVPDGSNLKPYALLQKAMESSDKVAVAKFVMRTKQYLAAIRPVDGRLMLSTMVYADELNDPAEVPELEALAAIELPERELDMARQLISSLDSEFEPAAFTDDYRQRVLDLIEAKASGATTVTPTGGDEPRAPVVDLMAALEASVAAAKASRRRHPSGAEAAGDDSAEPAEDAASRQSA